MLVMKIAIVIILVLEIAGGAWMVFGGATVDRYGIDCRKAAQTACVLVQERAGKTESWQVLMDATARASVEVRPMRKGDPAVHLWLAAPSGPVFAASFVGGSAQADAQAAADRLNQVFASTVPASARFDVEPPSWMGPATIFGYGFFVLLSLVVMLQLLKMGRTPDAPADEHGQPARG